jgi:hypothetical protein
VSPDRLEQAEQIARRLGPANCWTGTGGTLASLTLEMIRELKEPPVAILPHTVAEQLLEIATTTIRRRRETYGPPAAHFNKTVAAINAIFADKLREPLTASDWACIMILDKLARHQGTSKSTDTPVDLAGYAACLAEVEAEGLPCSTV